MEIQIIVALSVALSLTVLILLFGTRKNRRVHRKLETLETQIGDLKNLVKSLPQDNQIDALVRRFRQEIRSLSQDNQGDVFAEVVRQEVRVLLQDSQRYALNFAEKEINALSGIARRADELQVEIVRLEGRRLIAFSDSPPEISAHNPYWRDLSFWMRAKKQWTCENEECRINLEDRPSDLHVHHIRGRGYNSPQHLKVLCRACHAEEPGHAFMKAFPEYEAFLKWVKETQHE